MRISDWSSDVCSSYLTMIKSLQANPNILRFHVHYRCERAKNKPPKMSSRIDIPARNYPGRLKNRTARISRFERFAAYITCRSSRSEEHTSELQSLMRRQYAGISLTTKTDYAIK